jgi:chromosome segregation protein
MQLDLTISVKDLIYYQRTLTTINNELIKSKDDLKTFEPEEHQINETLKLLKKNLEDADEEVENCNIELNKINDEINKLEITKSSIKASLQNDLTGTNIEKKISAYQDLISSIKFDITNAEENVKKFNDEIEIYSEVITNSLKQKQTLEDDIRTKDNQLASIRSEINVLQQMSSNRDYTQNAQRIIIENKRALTGICGMVKEFISVDEKYEKAISIALGGSVNDIVTELTSDAEEAVNFLKSNRVGRATFLPLDAIKPREIKDEFKTVIETLPGFIGIANTLVKYANKYDNLFRNLLGSVIIANEINDATTISKYTYKMYRIVTLDGDIISPGGAITGGFNRANSLAINPEKRIKLLDENFTAISSELTTARINLEKINSEYQENENKQNERKILLDRYENIIKMNQNDLYKFEIEYEQLKQATGKGKNNKKDNNEENTLEKKIASLNTKKEKINVNLNVSRQNKTINKSRVEDLESKLNEVRTQKDKNRDVMFEQEKNKSKCEMAIENIREKINKNYKMTIEYATENYQSELPMSEQQARETIEKLEDEMERLGSINFDAVGELEEKQERYEKLSSQRSELEKAHNNINSTIMELDKKAKHDFSNIIEKTNASLIDIFKFLFGGGKCQLEYTNPDDILTSGIEVIATPPGKNTAHLNLLSGGEKSLVALSILFAILKNKTFPLVILDEAESALDPANVERFGNIIHRNSELTQFIVITHRAGTMERCDCLFGATMQTRGITSVYKISLSQAKNTIDEINEEDTTKKENKKKK